MQNSGSGFNNPESVGGYSNYPVIGTAEIPIEKFTSAEGTFVYNTFFCAVENEFVPILNHEHRGYCWVHLKDHPKPLHPGVWRTFAFESVKNKISTVEDIIKILNQPQTQNL